MNNTLLPPTHHVDDTMTIDLSDLNSSPTITIDPSWNTMAGVTYSSISNGVASQGATGSSGQIYTSSGINASWANLPDPALTVSQSGMLDLQGNNADIRINGESLMDTLRAIQDRLNVLQPNPELEAEWDQLRELGEQYRKLEKEFTEKSKMWKTLKKT